MSREITNTKSMFANQDLPDGRRLFMVVDDIVKKYGKSGAEFFIVTLQYQGGIGQQMFMPNMMGPLLKALGCQETEPNVWDWDTTEQAGKTFTATIAHQPDKKDPTKMRQHMSEIEKVKDEKEIPF